MKSRQEAVVGVVAATVGLFLIAMIVYPAFNTLDPRLLFGYGWPRSSTRVEACVNNLKRIVEAKRQCVSDHGAPADGILKKSDIAPYIKDVDATCFCPSALSPNRAFDSNYLIGPVGVDPTCVIEPAKHSLTNARHSLF